MAYLLFYTIFVINYIIMDAKQLWQLEKLGVNLEQSTIDIFANVLDLAEYLFDELSVKEEDRLRIELQRLKKPTN